MPLTGLSGSEILLSERMFVTMMVFMLALVGVVLKTTWELLAALSGVMKKVRLYNQFAALACSIRLCFRTVSEARMPSDSRCAVCMETRNSFVFFVCKHQYLSECTRLDCVCYECGRRLRRCPFCRDCQLLIFQRTRAPDAAKALV